MKSVLVTGGTVRLGAAIAVRLRADGWRVITSSHRADAGADIVADLAEPMGAAKLYAATLQLLDGNPPDALVNNAALFVGDAATLRSVNFDAPKKLTMMMAGRETGVGAVVNILDSAAIDSRETRTPRETRTSSVTSQANPAYLETKREFRAFTLSSAMMFAASLRVNGVAPGPVLAPTDVHEKAGAMLLDRRPTPEDVAAAVAYLLAAEAVTGVVLPVDAGQHLVGATLPSRPEAL